MRRLPRRIVYTQQQASTASNARTVLLEKTQDLVASHALDLSDAVGITQGDTNLGGRQALLGKLAHLLLDLLGSHVQPRWGSALVRESRRGNALAGCVHAAHIDCRGCVFKGVNKQTGGWRGEGRG